MLVCMLTNVSLAGALWSNPHLLVLDEPTNFLDRDSLGGLAVAIRDYKGGVVMISHNEEFVGALCPEQWHVNDGRLTQKGHLAVSLDRFEDRSGFNSGVSSLAGSLPGSLGGSAAGSEAGSAVASAVQSEAEGEMKFKARKKKKLTRAQMKEREVRRRLRHIEWLNSPKVCAARLIMMNCNANKRRARHIQKIPMMKQSSAAFSHLHY